MLGRMAAVPLAIKIVFYVGVTMLGLEENILRQGLLLLPVYFAEGWLAVQVIRFAVYGERGPEAPPSASRSRGIMAGTIIYVLTKIALSLFAALMVMGNQGTADTPPLQPAPEVFLIGLVALGAALWCFRLLWLYVPAALDRSVVDFLGRIKPFASSLYMMGTWLLCFVPLAVAMIMLSETMLMIFPPGADGAPVMAFKLAMAVAQAVLEILIAIIASAAMAYGIQTIYERKAS